MFSDLTPAAETFAITPLVLTDLHSQAGKGRNLCLVSDTRTTLMPTADQFARWLVEDGWNVTVLDLAPFHSPAQEPRGTGEKSNRPYTSMRLAGLFHERNNYAPTQALCAYHWLKKQAPDIVIFQHDFSSGYFCCMAKELGLAFAASTLVVMADDPYACWLEEAHHFPDFETFRTDAEIDYLEKQTVAKADGLLITRRQAFDWMHAAGWLIEGMRPALIVESVEQSEDEHLAVGEWLDQIKQKSNAKLPQQNITPLISVCVTASGNTRHLREALASLSNQTVHNFEVIVVDASESQDDAVRKEFNATLGKQPLIWIGQAGADITTLRNKAAQRAAGSYIYFIDEDDVVLPAAIKVLQDSLRFTTVDILIPIAGKHTNCDNTIASLARFPTQAAPGMDSIATGWIYYGANIATGLAVNVIGNACSIFRKDVFLTLGGFSSGAGEAGYRLLLCAACKGIKIHVMPEVLALNRRDKNGRILWHTDRFQDDKATLATLANLLPPALRSILLPFRAFNNEIKKLTRFPQTSRKLPTGLAKTTALFASSYVDDVVRVVLCADDSFLEQASITLASLLCSSTSKVEVYLLSTMGRSNLAKIRSVAQHFSHTLTALDVGERQERQIPTSTMWNKSSTAPYWRLWLPDYLPALDRVIYLDCDLIVRHDLRELWQLDLGTHFVAAVRDPIGCDVPRLVQDCGGDYFNSGVLLINLAAWRKEEITTKALAAVTEFEAQNYSYQFHEQSPLNKVIDGRWVVISPTWNYNDDIFGKEDYFNLRADELARIGEDPAIYHFRTNKKPWFPDFPSDMPYGREYRVYEKLVRRLLRNTEGNRE